MPQMHPPESAQAALLLWQRATMQALREFDPSGEVPSRQLYLHRDAEPPGGSEGSDLFKAGVRDMARALQRTAGLSQDNADALSQYSYFDGPETHVFARFYDPYGAALGRCGLHITWGYSLDDSGQGYVKSITALSDAAYTRRLAWWDRFAAQRSKQGGYTRIGRSTLHLAQNRNN